MGNPGSGKTTTLLQLVQRLCDRTETDAEFPIPVLFNLSTWKNQPLRDWLVAELKSKYGVRSDIGAKWVNAAVLLPLLDGLDELESLRQEACVKAINHLLASEYRPQYLVVCSRSEEYRNHPTRLLLNGAIGLQSLTDHQLQHYLTAIDDTALWNAADQMPELLALIRTPLFLSLTVLVYNPDALAQWQRLTSTEAHIQDLLEQYIQQMLQRPNSTIYGRHQPHPPNKPGIG